MTRPSTLVLLLLGLLLPGCLVSRTTFNAPLEPTALDELRIGESTAADVVDLLGAPTEVVQLAFRSAYRYDFTNSKRTGLILILVGLLETQTRSDRVWVFFDDDGLLTHHGATFEAGTARYGMPWQRLEGSQ